MEYPKYLLSLPSATKRRKSSTAQMDAMFGKGNYKIVNGFDARKIMTYSNKNGSYVADPESIQAVEQALGLPMPEMIQEDILMKDKWLSVNRGTVACTLGHYRILQDFISSENRTALIIEDDICFNKTARPEELNMIAQLVEQSNKPMIVSLHHHREFKNVYLYENSKVEMMQTALYRPKNPDVVWSSLAVFMNRQAAINLRDNMFPVRFIIDWFGLFLEEGWIEEFWCAYPFIAEPSGAPSLSFVPKGPRYTGLSAPFRYTANALANLAVWCDFPFLKGKVLERRKRLYGSNPIISTFLVKE